MGISNYDATNIGNLSWHWHHIMKNRVVSCGGDVKTSNLKYT